MTRQGGRGLLASIATAAGLACRPAAASDPATATMLFNEARSLVASGHYPEACPKFEESQRLDPGIGTQFNLADCYEHTARIASAWALFLDVASAAGGTGQPAREKVARRRASALEPRLSKLTIVPPKDVIGLEVRRNGELLGGMLWNRPTPVDMGSYLIETSAPGKKKWSTIATVGPNGATVTVAIPTLENRVNPTAPSVAARQDETNLTTPDADRPSSSPNTAANVDDVDSSARVERTIAIALGGAGVVGIGIGSFFGLRSIAKHSAYEAFCHTGGCDASAAPIHDQAVAAGNASTVAFLLGGALIAGGAFLWLVAPHPGSSTATLRVGPTVESSSAGTVVAGEW